MNDRRRALVARFRASAMERLNKATLTLLELEAGSYVPERVREVERELHTIKGESKMLDFVPLGEAIHAAEDLLRGVATASDAARRETASEVLRAFDAASRFLRAEATDDAALSALTRLRDELRAANVARPMGESLIAPAPSAKERQSEAPSPTAATGPTERWVQVSAPRIDDLCELVSGFEGEFRALYHRLHEQAQGAKAEDASARSMRTLLTDFDRCRAKLDDITSSAWGLRLAAVEPVLLDLLSHARAVAASQSKVMRISVDGGGTQLERSILDALADPLLHLVRNAVDHGIEPPAERKHKGEASLTIRAESSGPNVVITIADDGRGIDLRAVRAAAVTRGLYTAEEAEALDDAVIRDLLFSHGFSTKREVSELSGRGVGLDVVRSAVEAVGGFVAVTSELGQGTRFSMTLPATISKEKNLVFEASGHLYAVPSRQVAALSRFAPADVKQVAGGDAILHEGQLLPLLSMAATLAIDLPEPEAALVVLDVGATRWACTVPKPIGEFSLLRRPIDRLVASTSLVTASATFEDGRLVLILSLVGLVRQRRARAATPTAGDAHAATVLAIDDSAIVRDLMGEVLTHAGFEVRLASGGEAGLLEIARALPDVVLLDVDMPKMNGFEVLEAIRRQHKHLPVVMLTTRASAEDQRLAASLGASAYVIKAQFQEASLVQTLKRFVRGTR